MDAERGCRANPGVSAANSAWNVWQILDLKETSPDRNVWQILRLNAANPEGDIWQILEVI